MLNSKSQRITLTHISLALVGLMWVFPFLHYYHKHPITTFYQEWWSALLGVLALCGLLARDYWRQAGIPRIVQLPIALIAVVALQMALGMIAYAGQGLLYILYLLFAALMMMLGARLRDCFGMEKFALTLAIFLLAGAELSACLGLLQHYHLHTLLDSVLVAKVSGVMYGNLAQSDHFANYTALGLISLGLLFQKSRLRTAYVLPLAFVLLWVMALSSSRSSWLYLLMMSVLALWAGRNKPELRPLTYYCVLLLAGFLAVNYLVKLPIMDGVQNVSTLQRFSGADAFGGIRLYMWHEAWLMFAGAPWLGKGSVTKGGGFARCGDQPRRRHGSCGAAQPRGRTFPVGRVQVTPIKERRALPVAEATANIALGQRQDVPDGRRIHGTALLRPPTLGAAVIKHLLPQGKQRGPTSPGKWPELLWTFGQYQVRRRGTGQESRVGLDLSDGPKAKATVADGELQLLQLRAAGERQITRTQASRELE